MAHEVLRKPLWPEAVIEAITNPGQVPSEPLSERLARAVQAHAQAEEESIRRYRALAGTLADPVSQLVLQELLVDEKHHHALLDRLSAQFAYELDPHGGAAPWPAASEGNGAGPSAVRELADLARDEREGAKRMRELARMSRDEYGGLLSLLLEGMAADSEKHARMLRFVQGRQRPR
jgi:rubrerythrin